MKPQSLELQAKTLFTSMRALPHLRDIARGGSARLHQFFLKDIEYRIRCSYDSGGESFIQLSVGPEDDETSGFLRRTCLNHIHEWGMDEARELVREARKAAPKVLARHVHEQ